LDFRRPSSASHGGALEALLFLPGGLFYILALLLLLINFVKEWKKVDKTSPTKDPFQNTY